MCNEKLTGSQLSLPYGVEDKLTASELKSMVSPVQSDYLWRQSRVTMVGPRCVEKAGCQHWTFMERRLVKHKYEI